MTESSQPWVSMNDIFAAEETKLRKDREEREAQHAKQENPQQSAAPAQSVEESEVPSPTISTPYHPPPSPRPASEQVESPVASVQKQVPATTAAPPAIAP